MDGNMTMESLTNGSNDIITDNRNATSSPGNCTEMIGPRSDITNDGAIRNNGCMDDCTGGG